MSRATTFTTRVMANRTSPDATRADLPVAPDSPNLVAMLAAIVLPPGSARWSLMSKLAARTRAMAIVSPRARPRPSITAPTSPLRLKGRTAVRMVSQRVAPSARAASRCTVGAWRKISRARAATIGSTMTASTTDADRIDRP
jgi:hypothetical protein